MLYRTLTIDQLMQLDPPALAYALRLFDKELEGTIDFLKEQPEARKDEGTLEDLAQLLTLRKVFRLRLEELQELAGQASAEQSRALTLQDAA